MPEKPNIDPGNAADDFIDVFNYIDASDQQSEAAILNAAIGEPTYNHLLKEGFEPAEAAYVALGPERVEAITAGERELAELQYGSALAATGLRLEDFYQIHIHVADVGAFLGALRRTEIPASAADASRLKQGLADLTQKLLDATEESVGAQNRDAFEAAGGGPPYGLISLDKLWGAVLDAADPPEPAPSEEAAERDAAKAVLATEVIDHSAALADRLAELYPSQEQPGDPDEGAGMTRSLRQLHRAVNSGLLVEWAVAQNMQLLDTSEIGVERLRNDSEWERVYRLLDHLNTKAPNAAFTNELRQTILADIKRTLEAPFDPAEGGQIVFGTVTFVNTLVDPLEMEIDMIEQGPPEPQVASPEESIAYRARERAITIGMLKEVVTNVAFILPPPAIVLPQVAEDFRQAPNNIGHILFTLYETEHTLGDAGLEARDLHDTLGNVHAVLASTLEGTGNEHARQALAHLSAALGHLAAFLEANGAAVEYFRNYKL
ncbi:MAG TPA: hypothetical protein VLH86_03325 [Patescibacteria group bacterium]|nr:hypothetical protein [Patescibacteria group bacterium]